MESPPPSIFLHAIIDPMPAGPAADPIDAVGRAWDARELRRLARACGDLALRELTQSGRGPVRAPDFERRARRLLASFGGGTKAAPARLAALAAASLHQSHPCAMAQQIAAPVPLAALAESVAAALNQSIAVWDMSPAGTLVDRATLRRLQRLLGYPASAAGTFTPGGSFANLTALLAARAALAPAAWRRGGDARLGVLAGAQTHYSIARAAAILGLGADRVFPIPTDAEHRTDPAGVAAAAARARRAGCRRLILVGTSGSTSTGSFDDLVALRAEARRLGAWFHVDAAHGGGMAFSPRLRRLLRGLGQADSIAFDPHKMMFMPLSAGAVLVRRGAALRGAFEQHAPYLFRPYPAKVADVGPFTLACSQRFEALKIWLVWQAYGPELFAAMVEAACATAHAAYEHCLASPRFEPAHRPHANILCFRLRRAPRAAPAADRLHWRIMEAVNASGQAYLSSTVLDGRRCLRLVVMNPRSRAIHAARVLRVAERAAQRLAPQ
jgi:L-2,4-diaminobutyrate decarboxylase